VSIAGTNFDTAVSNDRIVFNATSAVTSSVTGTTQVGTSVPPNTTSGHITLTTPAGKAISAQDFYIPFLSYLATDIGYTGRTSMGNTQTVSLPTAGKIGLLLFDGSWGQGLSLNLSGSTLASCTLYVFAPNGSQVLLNGGSQAPSSDCTSATTLVSSIGLPSNGTYTIGIEPSTASGNITISLTPDFASTIAIDGSPVTATTTTVGQDARLSFNAIAGQRIAVFVTNVTNPFAYVYLIKPDGTSQTAMVIVNSPSGYTFFMDTQTLATTGTYQLQVSHVGSTNIGSETLQISSVPPDVSGSVAIGGAGFPLTTVAGQNAIVTFSNPQSQSVTVQWSGSTYSNCNLTVTGPSPSSNYVGGNAFCNSATGSSSLGTLAVGTYSILVDPQAQSTGGLTVSVTTP
jgi:hypothetical protein